MRLLISAVALFVIETMAGIYPGWSSAKEYGEPLVYSKPLKL